MNCFRQLQFYQKIRMNELCRGSFMKWLQHSLFLK
uniref:Uncharacterized protein n=1 Tax=Parascaris equorum TaxID=6256 RepID=A0A914RJ22_PAREQ